MIGSQYYFDNFYFMIPSHIDAFYIVADRLSCLIGLRQPNTLSDKWIGKPGYIPKAQKCKAKTANNPKFELGGLVVNPFLLPDAFVTESLSGAKNKWTNGFLESGKLPPGFSCAEEGSEKGLLKYEDCPIHADYDLMYVCKADRYGKTVVSDFGEQKKLVLNVQTQLNILLGIPMIQHGTEMGWDGGVGAAEREMIYSFGPGRSGAPPFESVVSKSKLDWH